IGRRHILTAAHCVHSYPEKVWSIVAGESAVDRPPSSSPIPVSKIHMHPDYKRPHYTHDIAILSLSSDIQWSDKSQPTCLPDDDLILGPEDGELAGWGYDNEKRKGGVPSGQLRS
ncbi:Transmembrane protease serine 9like, partial [Caligus rogercresseyi]